MAFVRFVFGKTSFALVLLKCDLCFFLFSLVYKLTESHMQKYFCCLVAKFEAVC